MGFLIYRDPISGIVFRFSFLDEFVLVGSIVFLLPFDHIERESKLVTELHMINRLTFELCQYQKEQHGGRGRLQAQYTGADTGAGNSSLRNFNDRHYLITTQFIRRKHRP
jgi:hypothetical protein